MKFKVGDKVKHKEYGVGEIVYINEEGVAPCAIYAVQFETFNGELHSLGNSGAPKVKNGHGWWCKESELELYTQQPQNLIPQIAKMLGVEIGERFKVDFEKKDKHYWAEFTFLNDDLFFHQGNCLDTKEVLFDLITGVYEIQKLPKKPILTEDEKAILRNLPKQCKYIARDDNGELYVYENKPKKYEDIWVRTGENIWLRPDNNYSLNNLSLFKHLFQFIKWEDKEPYNIEELLKE